MGEMNLELWDIIDSDGNPTGKSVERGRPLQPGEYHLVIHAWVMDSQGRFLIQKRADNVQLFPGIWAATGGSALAGEDSETAVMRELKEELGIGTARGDMQIIRRIVREDSILDIWLLKRDVDLDTLRLQAEEVSAARYVHKQELLSMIEAGLFHKYGSDYMDMVFAAAEAGIV